ncbi:ATP-binding protein [Streptomyces sp. NBC_00316]|uniref:ATP-binding protein n=1 Tax=Streptomyces sp. NBC_00316 TaxID=2975710 RepID=UPI002E2D21E2|nr:ATP-binding protein [Streptomyces sp. NBC_00316]
MSITRGMACNGRHRLIPGVVTVSKGSEVELRGRRDECKALDQLAAGVRAGQSGVLVVRGEAGVGKTALLDYLSARATHCRIVRSAGVEADPRRYRSPSCSAARSTGRGIRAVGRGSTESFPARAGNSQPAGRNSCGASSDMPHR